MANYQGPLSPEYMDEQDRQLAILSQLMPGDRQGITPQFSPEQIQDEASQRTQDIFASRQAEQQAAEAAKLASQKAAEAFSRDQMGLPPMAPEAPRAPAADVPSPPEIPQDGSLFDSISKRYQTLQQQGDVGLPGGVGGAGGKAGGAGKAPSQTSDNDYMSNLLSKIYGGDLSDSALKHAQGQRNEQQLFANLSKAGSGIGAAISGIKPQTDIQDSLIQQAEQPLKDILLRREGKMKELEVGLKASDLANQEKLRDPNSNVSNAYRSMAAQFSPQIAASPGFNKMSASGIKELLPMIDMAIRMEAVKTQKEATAKDKDEKDLDKRFDKVGKVLTSELAGNRTAFGKAATTYSSAEKIQTMLAGRNPNDLDSREIAELARQLDTILSNGSPTISGMKKLIPDSARGSLAKLEEYLTNTRQGSQMGSFVEQMLHTVDREKNLSSEQVQRTQSRLLAGNSDLAKKDPQRWNLLLKAHGLPDSVIDFDKKDQQSDEVQVKLPDGRIGMIPRSNLAKAKAMGAVEVKR